MDEVLCALCIAAVYQRIPMQRRNSHGDSMGEVASLKELKQAHAEGDACFEPASAIAVGVYAETFVKGVAMCAAHSLYVVNRLDLAKL